MTGSCREQRRRKLNEDKKILTVVFVLIFLVGLSLLLYPSVSDYWNSFHQSRALAEYSSQVEELDKEAYDQMWAKAEAYNQTLLSDPDRFTMTEEEQAEYDDLLNVSDIGIMGSIEIPAIDCSLPIYHGTQESVLQVAVGHLEGSSLPTGGKGTHCVLTGHRGLPRARLFTDLDKLKKGDLFVLKVLSRTMTYEVDQILTVDPYDMSALEIDPEQDYCTLATCTPYGINTHRLLVRGHRVENQETSSDPQKTEEERDRKPIVTIGITALLLLAVLLLGAGFVIRRKRRKKFPRQKHR